LLGGRLHAGRRARRERGHDHRDWIHAVPLQRNLGPTVDMRF
jgi:hypothetical protein